MCEFFSFSSDGYGRFYYFKPEDIKALRETGNPDNLDFNSHASISSYFKIEEDKTNKYEFNPYLDTFKIDQMNSKKDDRENAERLVRKLFAGFKTRKAFLSFCRLYRKPVDYKKLEKGLGDIPTKKDVISLVQRIDKIDWFEPQKNPIKAKLQVKVDSVLKAFKLDFKASVEINALHTEKDWDAARGATRDATRDATWDAARSATWDVTWDAAIASEFEVVKDIMKEKGYNGNPFALFLGLWEMGLYPVGVLKDKKFHVYYVPIGRKP